MVFNYKTLKEMSNSEIGNWRDWKIFSISVKDLENYKNKSSNTLYVLYDDENSGVYENNIVHFDTIIQDWKVVGFLTTDGHVFSIEPKLYKCKKKQLKKEDEEPAAITYSPGYEIDEKPIGDVKIDLVIEDILSRSRDLTISELLEGFN